MIYLRNISYELGLLKSVSYSLPVLSVGNLSLGGTGKTPQIEYLIRLLDPYVNVATLSRGYKRKTKGFKLVQVSDNALTSGDEPLQFKRKFPHIPVAVSESRNVGIPLLLKSYPHIHTVLLDDAFQHRAVVPGLNILLTDFASPFFNDLLLPAGRLREPADAYHRADLIVVTKCPEEVDLETKNFFLEKINPLSHQKVFFSKYKYLDLYYLFDPKITLNLSEDQSIILISAIASTDYLLSFLSETCDIENIIKYEDHHYFSDFDLDQIKKIYDNRGTETTVFVTTEKDATRLMLHDDFLRDNEIPIFVLPIEVSFLDDGKEDFDASIRGFLSEFRV